jgi:hypothetical protein
VAHFFLHCGGERSTATNLYIVHLIRPSSAIRIAIWGRNRGVVILNGFFWLVGLAASFYGRRIVNASFS